MTIKIQIHATKIAYRFVGPQGVSREHATKQSAIKAARFVYGNDVTIETELAVL